MECHKCRWASKIEVWEREGVTFDKTPCKRCSLQDSSLRTISYCEDRIEDAVDDKDEDEAPTEKGPYVQRDDLLEMPTYGGESEDGDVMLPVSVMADAVRLLMSLPKDALEVIRLRYGGMPYAKIAELMGKSVDAVEKRHLREIKRHPALGELFPRKVRKQRARLRRKKGKGK